MRRINLRLLHVFSSALLLVQTGTLRAYDTPPASSPPKGEIRKYTFEQSKIFLGTARDYWIYVPKQYDPARPACLYVNQDGIQYRAPDVFDRLIHEKAMPVVIGVFVTPGRFKATSKDALDRFNRSFEFDGLRDGYVRFLLDELLPEVEIIPTPNGKIATRASAVPIFKHSSQPAASTFTSGSSRSDG